MYMTWLPYMTLIWSNHNDSPAHRPGSGCPAVRHSSSSHSGGWKISSAYTRGQYDA